MRGQLASPDLIASRIAARHHGVVTFAQLLGAGLSKGGIDRRVSAGRLHRVHRGVYAVGHPALSNEGRWFAAVAAGGEGAVLSHRSAAELWGILPIAAGPIHVSVPGAGGRSRRQKLRIHHPSSLLPTEATRRDGIAVTTPARTIADLRRTATSAELRRALRQASFLGLDTGDEEGGERTRSELERHFLHLCRRHRLPSPDVNVRVGPYTVDFLWRERKLVVETDGWRAHRGRQAFEDDRERDAYLRLRSYEALRFSWRQIVGEPGAVAAVLRRYLL